MTESVDSELLDKVLLYTYFEAYQEPFKTRSLMGESLEGSNADVQSIPLEGLEGKVIDRMTPKDVAKMLEDIDKIRSIGRNRHVDFQTKVRITNQVNYLLSMAVKKYGSAPVEKAA